MIPKPQPPAPPPMRVGNGAPPDSGVGFYLCSVMIAVAFGVMCGLKMEGKI